MTPCPECGSERVATGLRTESDGNGLRFWRRTRFWGAHDITPVRALVCIGCGLVTLFAAHPDRLREDLIKNRHLYGWEELDD